MFRFKQFTIQQDRTAMKVCTDACLLGAYADVGPTTNQGDFRILDIGTGTGLLSLMAAQRNPTAYIDAVEIDPTAAQQATENIAGSPFARQITVFNSSIQDFAAPTPRYDRILTNPPFYTNHLRSPDAAVNRALHTDDLPFGQLIEAVNRLLQPDGQWWVLLPPYEMSLLTDLATHIGLTAFRQLQVQHHSRKPVFRHITGFSLGHNRVQTESLAIYEPDGRTYTHAFSSLLADFYLIF